MMKTVITFKLNVTLFVLFLSMISLSVQSQDQSSNESVSIKRLSKIQPVKITFFTTTFNNNKAELRWETASEINLSHFVIEKSTDGVEFNDAGVFFSYGNATVKTEYIFSDKLNNIQTGRVYYRLYSVANDGKGEYSETSVVNIDK